MAKYKYENIDIISFLETQMKLNTKHYQSDFDIDKELFLKAANHYDASNKNLLWLSRTSGTECVKERDAFIGDTAANLRWKYFAGPGYDNIVAFAVEISGVDNGTVVGSCYELDYYKHVETVKRNSITVKEEHIIFEDGYETYVEFPNNYYKTAEMIDQHGSIVDIRYISNDETRLKRILKYQSEERKKMPVIKSMERKGSLDMKLNSIKKNIKGTEENKKNNEYNFEEVQL